MHGVRYAGFLADCPPLPGPVPYRLRLALKRAHTYWSWLSVCSLLSCSLQLLWEAPLLFLLTAAPDLGGTAAGRPLWLPGWPPASLEGRPRQQQGGSGGLEARWLHPCEEQDGGGRQPPLCLHASQALNPSRPAEPRQAGACCATGARLAPGCMQQRGGTTAHYTRRQGLPWAGLEAGVCIMCGGGSGGGGGLPVGSGATRAQRSGSFGGGSPT